MVIPVANNPGSITRFLSHIQQAGKPEKVSTAYLKAAGFKSGNDTSLIGVFKALGFLDSSGVPTDKWLQHRDKSKSGAVLAEAMREAYGDLFQLFPDANRKDDEAIANWVRSNSEFPKSTVERAVRTFKALCSHADFNIEPSQVEVATVPSVVSPVATTVSAPATVAIGTSPSVNINIELHLPATNDPQIYENFFAAMKKNLFDEA